MPKPSQLWYPTSLADQVLWHKVFSEQATADGTTHGLTAAEVTQIVNDYNMVLFLANVMATLDAYDDSIRGFRRNVMEEPIDGTTPAFPADISFTVPTLVPPSPDSIQPAIEVSAAVHGYLFSVVVSGRAEADSWEVWIRPNGTDSFQKVATATGKSVDVTYSPGTSTGAVVLEVYVQLRKGNTNYGDPSDIVLVTVNP